MADLLDKIKAATGSQLKQGSKVPAGIALKEDNPEKPTVQLDQIGGKFLIVGVPGAFTPPCSSHVPGYVEHADQLAAKGIKSVYIVAVNDAFTTQAWKEKLGSSNPNVHFLADDTGAFTKAAGLSFDASGLLGNVRSQRYVAVIENGIVQQIFIEDEAPNVTVTKADNVLQALS